MRNLTVKTILGTFLILVTSHIKFSIFNFQFLIKDAHAAIDISKEYAFGQLQSLGQGFSFLVAPGFSIAAVAVAFYFIIGAFKYITSGGDDEAVAGAREMMTHAVIGFILLMFIFVAIPFLLYSLFGIKGFGIIQF